MSVKFISILTILIILTVLLFRKKLILPYTAIGTFFICHILFILIGLIIIPWTKEVIFREEIFFSGLNLIIIRDETIIKTFLIIVSGLILVLISYSIGNLVLKKSPLYIHKGIFNNSKIEKPSIFQIKKLRILLTFFISVSMIQLIPHISVILEAIFGSNPHNQLNARRVVTSNYLLTISIYNIIPFLTSTYFGYYLLLEKKSIYDKMRMLTYNSFTILLLLLVFQKRPLILFLLSLMVIYSIIKHPTIMYRVKSSALYQKIKKRLRLIIASGGLFVILFFLYITSTNYINSTDNPFELITTIVLVVASRIIGRLSMPAIMYVHYFPSIEDFYLFSNIGLFSKVFQTDLFPDSKVVYEYFVGEDNGSLAASAIIDFYGGFGILGVAIGCLVLGLLLRYVDYIFENMRPNITNKVLQVYLLISVFYLSQASLPRTMMGYGAIFFIIFWFILSRRFKW
ncbi:oligosaccharide repeat unit polymerase [Halobacillus sp. GSS1]|uniref:O-antigen polymerase n=1 Tax=Halobacillus sp. GSS1 TaxID=2815919 RepID=UPI001A8F0451|nr:O-antigen polymerase [Halobacillus sp. GSS1]MBN9655049.1 oligosaccharide repeat unit polymerase [Halobacillus sp. GSS1]